MKGLIKLKYLLLGGSVVFSFYRFPSFHDFIIFIGLIFLYILVMNEKLSDIDFSNIIA